MNRRIKVMQVAAADITVQKLLLPLIDRLSLEGYDVHIACSDGPYARGLAEKGYNVRPIAIARRVSPVSNLRSLLGLYHLMKRERPDIVHVHTPVAAALGRVAAWAARVPAVFYTAHGFYFHENTPAVRRRVLVGVERVLCRVTDRVFTQSYEDYQTAIKEGICSEERLTWIGNGIDIARFPFRAEPDGFKKGLQLSEEDRVVGFVGRLVAEKGVPELAAAMELVARAVPTAKLLVVGDTLNSDRDQACRQAVSSMVERDGLTSRVVFAGFVEDVPRAMSAIDVFVLPSHREGMPRTIIEAMASGKPVVATNIRGCREEVVEGKTGHLVPVNDPPALASAIISILSQPELASEMGRQARLRACEMFDENIVIERQLRVYSRLAVTRGLAVEGPGALGLFLKRAVDVALSLVSLTVLALPFALVWTLIKLDSPGPVFFRQERIGKNGRSFRVWKFRTMVDGAVEKGLGVNVAKDDSRITRAGKVLRNFGLDELPQLINVLKGEMSIVGPRPTLGYQVEQYDDFEKGRLLVRPGITGLAVIEGRNLLSWEDRIKLDVRYVEQWSLCMDVRIILRTFGVVLLKRRGVYGANGTNDDFVSSKVAGSEHN